MNFLKGLKVLAVAGILIVVGLFSSCEQELTTIGDGVIGGEPFTTNKATYDVFAFNRKIEAVQTNKLPIYQLGVLNDPVYGKTEASITSQVQLDAYNPVFGDSTQAKEISSEVFENEKIDSVYIYIPYLTNDIDTDNDGVVDNLDGAPDDPTNDDDNDGVPNNVEAANNTDPLNADTDGDNVNDGDDDSTLGNRFPERFKIDSIYCNCEESTDPMNPTYLGKTFNLKVEESTFFLRDLDPNTNFLESQEYFSSKEFSPTFTDEVFYDGTVTISDQEILFVVEEDDPATTDVDEKGTISSKLSPGIYVKLNEVGENFFENNILNNEGGSQLSSASNFKTFFRGIHISSTPTDDELLMLLDIADAKMDVYYSYDKRIANSTDTERAQKTFSLNLNIASGNAVNTFVNEAYPPEITSALSNEENADRIYLKGGAGSFAEIKLFDAIDGGEIINEIKANNWIINEANLVFYVDSDVVPETAIEPSRLYLYNAETNGALYNEDTENNDPDSTTPLGLYLNYDGILEESSDARGLKYTVKITEYINNIIIRDSVNATLGLTITPDIRLTGSNNAMLSGMTEKDLPVASILSPLGTVLFGSNVPEGEEKKLKLEIFYTETN